MFWVFFIHFVLFFLSTIPPFATIVKIIRVI